MKTAVEAISAGWRAGVGHSHLIAYSPEHYEELIEEGIITEIEGFAIAVHDGKPVWIYNAKD